MKLDGVNLIPFLTGQTKSPPHDNLFWRSGVQLAIRSEGWKLVRTNASEPAQLYNLAQDIGEKSDLAAKQPEKAKELQTAFDSWNKQLSDPKWVRSGRRRR